jgi:hypothetical protein
MSVLNTVIEESSSSLLLNNTSFHNSSLINALGSIIKLAISIVKNSSQEQRRRKIGSG